MTAIFDRHLFMPLLYSLPHSLLSKTPELHLEIQVVL